MRVVKRKSGHDVTLLNPQEKKAKAYKELEYGFGFTNDGEMKLTKDGSSVKTLSKGQRAYRSGLIAGITCCQKAYIKKQK